MHTCFKDYVVHHKRIRTIRRYDIPSYGNLLHVLYGTVPYNARTLYGPIDAMIRGDDPMALYFLNKIII